ncbi:MAG: phosphate uptake regulator PhoU [Candidatus Bathyarchaeia archaeon]
MVVRRVQEVGGTYFITLPKGWVLKLGIRRGAEVHVEERGDGILMISPSPGETMHGGMEAFVTYPMNLPVTLKELVTSLYLSGYDLIRIKSADEGLPDSERKSLLALSRKLAGMEVLEEDREAMTIRCVLDPSSMRPIQILRRMGFLVSDMIYGLSYVDDVEKLKSVVSTDDEVDRSYLLLVRLLRSALRVPWLSSEFELEPTDYLDYRVAAGIVESIGDRISDTAEACMLDKVLKAEVKSVSEALSEIAPKALGLSLDAFITNDYAKITEARSTLSKLCHRKSNSDSPLLNFIQEACRNLMDLVSIEKIARKHIKS